MASKTRWDCSVGKGSAVTTGPTNIILRPKGFSSASSTRGYMLGRSRGLVVLVFVSVASPSYASSDPLEDFMPIVGAAQEAAALTLATVHSFGDATQDLVRPWVPGGSILQAVVLLAERDVFLATGEGRVDVFLSTVTGSCEGMQAVVEYHEAISSETNFHFQLAGGKGSPTLLCAAGWNNAFRPDEVQGNPETGWEIHSRTIDAHTDVELSALRGDGSRDLFIRQVTFPQGFGDILEFRGKVHDV